MNDDARMQARLTFKGRDVSEDIVTTDDEELRFWLMDLLEHEQDGVTIHERLLADAVQHIHDIVMSSRERDDAMTNRSGKGIKPYASRVVEAVNAHGDAVNAAIEWARKLDTEAL